MKKIISLFAVLMLLSIAAITKAQTPQAIKYQAIARNATGEVIANQNVSFRVSILKSSAEGTIIYQEVQATTTNQFGLANLSIGLGSTTNGVFDSIKWGNATYFAKIEFDPKGGSEYALMGTSQLLSVPYSLYAEHAKVADNLPVFPIKTRLQATNLQAPFNAPETGMLVYNTDSAGIVPNNVVPGYYYNAGTTTVPNWVLLSIENSKGFHNTLSCNTDQYGTCAGIGITPNNQNNTGYGYNSLSSVNTSSDYNSAYGSQALNGFQVGAYNTALGAEAMQSATYANNCVAIGYQALQKDVTDYNTAVGSGTLANNTTGNDNCSFGYVALNTNTTGYDNTAMGSEAMYFNTTGNANTAIGLGAVARNTIGYYNTGIGYDALGEEQSTSSTNGNQNTAIGALALTQLTNGVSNTASGFEALDGAFLSNTGSSNTVDGAFAMAANVGGSWNTATGDSALATNTSGEYNVASGYQAMAKNKTAGDNTAIGYQALYSQVDGGLSAPWSAYNVAIGNYALYDNLPTSTGNGVDNTAIGWSSLYGNTTGLNNTSIGMQALYANGSASDNTAVGYAAAYSTSAWYNSAFGELALYSNVSGSANTAIGQSALFSNTASYNTAVGASALYHNSTGVANDADGYTALVSNTSGSYNTAMGNNALYSNSSGTGNDNTALGFDADISGSGISNTTVIGYDAAGSASNWIYLGNSSINGTVLVAGAHYTGSDARIKKDVQQTVPGLSFIMKLRPVTYHYDMDKIAQIIHTPDSMRLKEIELAKGKTLYSGFIAQEVEKSAQECGYDFSGVSKPQNENDFYKLSYEQFTVPLVKAIQEQQEMIDKQNKEIEELKKMVESLVKRGQK